MVYGSTYGTTNYVGGIVPEAYEESMDIMDIGMQIMEESAEDWNSMMRAIASVELGYVVENHQEMIYEAVDVKAWGEKVIAWFKNILKKILGMLQTAKAKFMSFATKDATFISKYESRIREGAGKLPTGFSFKGYKFGEECNLAEVVKDIEKAGSNAESYVKKFSTGIQSASAELAMGNNENKISNEQVSDIKDELRGDLAAGGSDKLTRAEFKKELFKIFHGSSSKVTINSSDSRVIDANYIVETIKGAKKAISTVEKQKNAVTKQFNSEIKLIEGMSRDAQKAADAADKDSNANYYNTALAYNMNACASILKEFSQDMSTYCTMLTTALKDENRQAKAVAVKFVSYAGYKGKLNESYATQSYGSVFDEAFANI